jgi:hypothetical protein
MKVPAGTQSGTDFQVVRSRRPSSERIGTRRPHRHAHSRHPYKTQQAPARTIKRIQKIPQTWDLRLVLIGLIGLINLPLRAL